MAAATVSSDLTSILAASAERSPWGWALLASVLLAIIKGWPLLTRLRNERETGLLGAQSIEMEKLNRRIEQLEAKAEAAMAAAHSADMKLIYAVNAVQLLAAKIRAHDPNDPALAQAMELLRAATSGEVPAWAGKLAAGINQIRGTGE